MHNEENTPNGDRDDILNDDSTDEFPILDPVAYAAAASSSNDADVDFVAPTDDQYTTKSLSRLEADILTLQSRWSTVEEDVRARDVEIDELTAELALRQAGLQSVRDELAAAADEREILLARLDAAAREQEALEAELAGRDEVQSLHDEELQEREHARGKIAGERDVLKKEIQDLETRLTDQRSLADEAAVGSGALENANNALREQIQDLEAYVDRRKLEWEGMQTDLAGLRGTVSDQEKTLKKKDGEIRQRGAEKTALSNAIADLEQRCAELDGRRTEREASNVELQDKLVESAKQMEQLAAESRSAGDARNVLVAQVEGLDNELTEARAELSRANDRIAELEAHADKSAAVIAEKDRYSATATASHQEELDTAVLEHEAHLETAHATHEAELAERLAEERGIAAQLREEIEVQARTISESADELSREQAALAAATGTAAEAEAARLAADERGDRLETELAEQHEVAAGLEARLADKNKELLERWEGIRASGERVASLQAQLEAQLERQVILEVERDRAVEKLDASMADLSGRELAIRELEGELRAQKEAIAMFDRNVERIADLGAHVQKLDHQISQQIAGGARRERADAGAGEGAEFDHLRELPETTRLLEASKGDKTIRFPLYKDNMIIGRSAESDIQLRWRSISRQHAKITSDGEATIIEDMGSKNGVYIDDVAVKIHELHDGDTFDIGEIRFRFVNLDEQSAAPGTRH